MNLQHWLRSTPGKPLGPLLDTFENLNEEYTREFGEFVESISVTAEELEAIVSTPGLSISEIKRHLRDGSGYLQANRTSPGSAGSHVVKIRLSGARSTHA